MRKNYTYELIVTHLEGDDRIVNTYPLGDATFSNSVNEGDIVDFFE